MEIEDQKFMALEGLHTWADGVVVQAARLTDLQSKFSSVNFIEVRRAFERERLSFLVAARRLLRYIDWALELNFLDPTVFTEFQGMAKEIKDMRDLNEHVIEYFKESGQRQQEWWHRTTESLSDASSTVGSRIGNRLDWNQAASAAKSIIDELPARYSPKKSE